VPDDIFSELGQSDNERLQVARELFTVENIKLKTDIDDREVLMLTRLLFLADRFMIPEMADWVDNFMKLRVSRRRKGRGEYIEAVKQPAMDMGGFAGNRLGGFNQMRKV
jgi:hypothetical protein